jgi:multidrug transporter EmrE-like cation transporter
VTIRSVAGGIILGVPNYFSIYAITKALDSGIVQSSVLYPINNMGIVICSAIGAVLLFREKLSWMNWTGIAISVLAIGMIAFF